MSAGRAPGQLPGSAAHFKVCKAKREALELFQDNFLFHQEVPQGESCPHAGRARPVLSRRAGAGEELCPASNPQKPATQVRLLWTSLSRGRRSEPQGWHSLCRATDHPARGNSCRAAVSQPRQRECLRLHTQHLEINSVATRDKEESVQEDTFPAPRSKRGVLCLSQRLPPGSSHTHLLLLNASAAPAAAQGSPCLLAASTGMQPGQGTPGLFWSVFLGKFVIVLTEVLAARWSEQVWLCLAEHCVAITRDSASGVQLKA